MSQNDLTDKQWQVLESLLPQQKPGCGRPRTDNRECLNGILYVLKTCVVWLTCPSNMVRRQRAGAGLINDRKPDFGMQFGKHCSHRLTERAKSNRRQLSLLVHSCRPKRGRLFGAHQNGQGQQSDARG